MEKYLEEIKSIEVNLELTEIELDFKNLIVWDEK
jgi:hypothetical protein